MKQSFIYLFLITSLLFSCEADYSANQIAIQTEHLDAAIEKAYKHLDYGVMNRGMHPNSQLFVEEAERMLKLYRQAMSSDEVESVRSLSLNIWTEAKANGFANEADSLRLDQYLKVLNRNSLDEFKTALQIMVLEQLHALTNQDIERYALFDVVGAIVVPRKQTIRQGEDYYFEVGLEASMSALKTPMSMKVDGEDNLIPIEYSDRKARGYAKIKKPSLGSHSLEIEYELYIHGNVIKRELTHTFEVVR